MMNSLETVTESRTSTTNATEAQLREWARRGTEKWQETAAAIIAFGLFLIEAKVAAGYGNFSRLFKDHAKPVDPPMPITLHTGEKLMRVARTFSNSTYTQNLPASLETTFILTHLPEEIIKSHIRSGLISPELTQNQAKALVYGSTRYKNFTAEQVIRDTAAYKKRLNRREALQSYPCLCVCGDKHPDRRLIPKTGRK